GAAPRAPAPAVERRAPGEEPSGASSAGRVTEADARQWVDRLRTAWDRKDTKTLRELGELPASGKLPRRVGIGEGSINPATAGAGTVGCDEVGDGARTRSRAGLVRDPAGRVVRR